MKHFIVFKVFILVLLTSLPIGKMWAGSGMPDDGNSNESLLKGYVQQMLDEALPASKRTAVAARRSAVAQLTGTELKVYNLLLPVMKEIAAGTITSTVVNIPVADIFGKKEWTAADLGYASITDEALTAFQTLTSFNFNKVVNALLADLPYDLYWYDKTKGYSYSMAAYWYSSSSIFYQDGNDSYTFNFYVAKEYSKTDEVGTTDVMPGIISSVSTAIANAQAIVDANSAKPLLAKLDAYRQAICDRVSYNDDAASNDATPYGNPWQLVWVFDDNPNTKVVCEGYSKAFKYLCDLSSLGTGVECLLVSGYMATSGGGGGNHMWNVMKMDDGRSYLVDVTNCDGSTLDGFTVGYPNKLFMAAGFSGSYGDYYEESWTSPNVRYYYDSSTKAAYPEADLTLSAIVYDNGILHIFETLDIA